MITRSLKSLLIALLLIAGSFFPSQTSRVQSPVVYAVLFYSPTCPHCEYVITEILPPLFDEYGDQLQIIGVNVQETEGSDLFKAAAQSFGLDQAGVPFLVVGDRYLMGSVDIPEQFPGLVEQYLSQGGVDWPAIPGLAEVLAASGADAAPDSPPQASPGVGNVTQPSESSLAENRSTDWRANFALDPAGNSVSVIVLAGMVLAVVWGFASFRRSARIVPATPGWVFPALCAAGLIAAGYLAYVEVAHVAAVCGPVGDCNTVQQSDYARLFGVLPIGVLGLVGYVLILLAWAVYRYGRGKWANYAALGMLVMTSAGILFSIYLTFLEPFVIGATCAWCITSAVIMTLLFLLSLDPGRQAVSSLSSSSARKPRGKAS
jgi:uncharacterized membrane protein